MGMARPGPKLLLVLLASLVRPAVVLIVMVALDIRKQASKAPTTRGAEWRNENKRLVRIAAQRVRQYGIQCTQGRRFVCGCPTCV